MENKDILDGSKLIANYLNWKYIPSNDLQGFQKAGWHQINKPQMLKIGGWVNHPDGDFAHRWVCRTHAALRFYNSMDALLPVIEKLEKEDLGEYFYKWELEGEERSNFMNISFTLWFGGCYSDAELQLDPPMSISSNMTNKFTWIQNTFKTVVETIKYVEQVKSRKEDELN